MKNIIKSRSAWLGVALAILPQIPALTEWLVESGAAGWAVSAAGVVAVLLRMLTKDAVTLRPQAPRVDPVAFIIIAVLMVTSCATTCDVMTIKRQPWADGGPDARQLVYQCGQSTITHKVRKPPVCLDACFKAGD